jgi:preprotein translocase subunit YajC
MPLAIRNYEESEKFGMVFAFYIIVVIFSIFLFFYVRGDKKLKEGT